MIPCIISYIFLYFVGFFLVDPAAGSPTAALLRLVSDLESYTHSLKLVRVKLHLR